MIIDRDISLCHLRLLEAFDVKKDCIQVFMLYWIKVKQSQEDKDDIFQPKSFILICLN